jgi:ribokinase
LKIVLSEDYFEGYLEPAFAIEYAVLDGCQRFKENVNLSAKAQHHRLFAMPKVLVCGVINWDVTLFVDQLPEAGEEVRVNRVLSFPGGKGANTAVAAARILGSAAQVGLIGMLGSDDTAARQIKILREEGLDTSCIMKDNSVSSGQAYVIIDSKGEDMILTHRAANQMMTRELVLRQNVTSAIEQASMIIIIDPPLEVASTIIEHVRNKKMDTTVIWSPALLARHGLPALYDHMRKVDYAILNELEAKLLAESSATDDGIYACAKVSESLGGKKVVTTLGRKGCIFCEGGKKILIPSIDLASFDLRTVNTAGAGDAFIGAFAALKIKGFDDLKSLFLANIAAALKTAKEETQGSPNYDEIKHYSDLGRSRSLYESIKRL